MNKYTFKETNSAIFIFARFPIKLNVGLNNTLLTIRHIQHDKGIYVQDLIES